MNVAIFIFAIMTLKQKVYDHYMQVVNEKLNSLQQVLADLKESGSNETKSTAGDKHETALAMLQIEQANVGAQLQDIREKKVALEKIDPASSSSKIVNGSLVKTDKGYLFISIASGKTTIDDNNVIALSPQSPLGKKLMGLSVSDIAEINNNKYVIETIE
jgi:transcription elongation GreA/GreB family factor